MKRKCPDCRAVMSSENMDSVSRLYDCAHCKKTWYQINGETRLRNHDEWHRLCAVYHGGQYAYTKYVDYHE
jgi:transposase-like protein